MGIVCKYVVGLESLLVLTIQVRVQYVLFHLNLYDNKELRRFEHQLSLMGLMKPMDLGRSYRYHFREFCYITLRLSLLSSHRYK